MSASIRRQVYVQFVLILMCKLFSTFAKMKLLVKTILPTGKTHSGTVIFFHGSGDTGSNLMEWIRFLLGKDMNFPHIKVILPTAPVQPYTPLDGQPSNVWFDRNAISKEAKESRKSLASAYNYVNELIKTELDQGIAMNRIVVGGFSMGGALALHSAYHVNQQLAGCFACSSFLNDGTIVYESLRARQHHVDSDSNAALTELPKLLMFHGDRDSLVPIAWGQQTYDELVALGVRGDFRPVRNALHELKVNQMVELQDWILKMLPPLDTDLPNKL